MSTEMKQLINDSIDEFLSGKFSLEQYFQAITPLFHPHVISTSCLHVLEKCQKDRLETGGLFAKLVKQDRIKLDDYCNGLEEILAQAEVLKTDMPQFWEHLADILVDIVIIEVLSLDKLFDLSKKHISQCDVSNLFNCLYKSIIEEIGPTFLQELRQKSQLQLTDFLNNSSDNSFVDKEKHFEFLLDGSVPARKKQLSYEELQARLSALLRQKASHDKIFDWVTANVGDQVKEKKFIRTLATAIFEDSISPNMKLQKDVLLSHTNLLLKYMDTNSSFELEGLYALQALIHKLDHPQDLLLEICSTLLDNLIFSQESFVAWEKSNDPAEQEGKGLATKQLKAFMCQLKEDDDDEDDTSSEET